MTGSSIPTLGPRRGSSFNPATVVPRLVVLSPHLDDAAFSVGITLRAWLARGWPLRVINCFSVSNYAPYAGQSDVHDVTRTRKAEDQAFAASLGAGVKFNDLDMLDAPLRLGCSADVVCELHLDEISLQEQARILGQAMGDLGAGEIVLAPLAVGGHVDHVIARHACITRWRDHPMVFYEDLPYSTEFAVEHIVACGAEAGRCLGRPVQRLLVSVPDAAATKETQLRHYASQLGEEEISQIVTFTSRLRGERLWADPASASLLEVGLAVASGRVVQG